MCPIVLLHNACVHRAAVNDIELRNAAARRSACNTLLCVVDLHLKCKAGFVESFEWGEIVESLSWSIVEPVRHVCKGVL
jgi:hypothetical protein